MRIIAGTTDFRILQPTAVAIGKFDGLHLGHRELLKQILQMKKEGLLSTIFTFDPPPEVLFGKRQAKEITTKEEKRIIFKKMGVDILIEYPLNEVSAAIEPEEFVKEVLKEVGKDETALKNKEETREKQPQEKTKKSKDKKPPKPKMVKVVCKNCGFTVKVEEGEKTCPNCEENIYGED